MVAGVIDSSRDQDRYAEVFALPIRSVRLVASPAVVEARLRGRYTEHQGANLSWHLERYAELTKSLDLNGLDEAVVDTSELSPRSVATVVLEHFGRNPRVAAAQWDSPRRLIARQLCLDRA